MNWTKSIFLSLVLVGAMVVASIETTWAGTVAPGGKNLTHFRYDEEITLQKGDEMGRFKLGSTVILLFPQGTIEWRKFAEADKKVKVGEAIADIIV